MGYVYDIEIFPNLLLIVFKSIHTGEIAVVEKSARKDNTKTLKELVSNNLLIGYNNHEYDDIIINNILANPKITNKELYILSSNIVNRRQYKKLKTKSYTSIDMMKMLFSKALRVSLKELQVSMMWHNVLESSVPFDQPVALDIVDKEVYKYSLNDVESTYHLFNLKKDDIKLRLNIKDKYGIDCLSDDPVRIGVDILTERIIADTPGDKEKNRASFNSIRNVVNEVSLKDVINYDIISFELPQLIDLVEQIKEFTVIPKKKYFEAEVKIEDTVFSVGSGGLHAVIDNLIIEPKDDEEYLQADVSSFYPSQIVDLQYHHEFLGDKFLDVYSEIRKQRFEAKRNKDKAVDAALKLSLVAIFGQFNNEYSPYYSSKMAMRITINGQLMLLMLIEKLFLNGFKIVSANTDSVDVIIKKSMQDRFYEICNWWQEKTKMGLEYDSIAKIVYQDVNNYFAKFTNGYVKEKGRWLTKPQLGKGFNMPIKNIALREYFMNGISVEQTVLNCKEPLLFCAAQRVGKAFQVIWQDKVQQRINRYYVSLRQDADHIYKRKGQHGNLHNLLKGQKVSLLNNINDFSFEELQIDFQYYINETSKIINEIEDANKTSIN